MTVVECQQRMTWREFAARCRIVDDELNHPDRHDRYLMQLAYEVAVFRGIFTGKFPQRHEQFKLKFQIVAPSETSREDKVAMSKGAWRAWTSADRSVKRER